MLKLRVKTLLVQASLEHFQIICGFENSWEFPFCAKYYDGDCSFYALRHFEVFGFNKKVENFEIFEKLLRVGKVKGFNYLKKFMGTTYLVKNANETKVYN